MRKKSDGTSQQQRSSRPKPPFPGQGLEPPCLEKEMAPRPQYLLPHYEGSHKLQDKVAFITGGDSGIGRAVAVLFAREGADVAIACLPAEHQDAEETRQAVEREGRRCLIFEGDVTDFSFCEEALHEAHDSLGHLDIIVNNAAFQKHTEDIEELSLEQWDKTFKTNIYGYFYVVKAALPLLGEGATIINCGSITGLVGSPNLLDYSSTKGAIHAFTKSLAKKLSEKKIRVNAVAPGPVWTPLNPADVGDENIHDFGSKTPFGRPAQPEEIAPTFVYLASDLDSSFITGEIISILGGEVISN